MSGNATNSSNDAMDCGRVTREEVGENYLLGKLSGRDREAFEEHYFGCDRCFDELQTLQAIRQDLPGLPAGGRTSSANFKWAAALSTAAAVVLAVGITWSIRQETTPPPPVSESQAPSARATPPAPTSPKPPATPATPSLDQLARVDPPPFEAPRLRGVPDEATARFQSGMTHYRRKDYRRAVVDLRAAVTQDPEAPHSAFFLGISQLMLRQDAAAIAQLRATIALGASGYLEDAHFYLAKALLRKGDLAAARVELDTVVRLRGSRSADAGRLIAAIDKLKSRAY